MFKQSNNTTFLRLRCLAVNILRLKAPNKLRVFDHPPELVHGQLEARADQLSIFLTTLLLLKSKAMKQVS